jgi:hypothetical protein
MATKPLSEALQRLLSRLDGSYPDGGFILIGMPSTTEQTDVTIVSNLDPTSICQLMFDLVTDTLDEDEEDEDGEPQEPPQATQGGTVH